MAGGGGVWGDSGIEVVGALGLESLLSVGRERTRPEIFRAQIEDTLI
jgi:hypothetical protein